MAEKTTEEKQITFNLAVDYQVKYPEAEQPESIEGSYAEITKDYIVSAVMMSNREGLDSQYRRLWATIEKKIEDALLSKNYVVTFHQGEYNFIVNAFKAEKTKFVPQLAKYVVKLEDALASATF